MVSNQKERLDVCYNMNKPQRFYANEIKPKQMGNKHCMPELTGGARTERIMAVTEAEVGQPETAEWSSCRWTSDLKRCISRAVGRDLPSSQEILSLIHSSSYK